jgi:hypothetical protein
VFAREAQLKRQSGANPQDGTSAPPRSHRLTWWWLVYVGTILGVILYNELSHPIYKNPANNPGLLSDLIYALFLVPFVPYGLGVALVFAVDWAAGHMFSETSVPWQAAVAGVVGALMLLLGYVIYIVHWNLTCKATTMRNFLLLMLSFVLLTTGGLTACSKIPIGPIQQ